MGTEIVTLDQYTPTPQIASSLSQEELQRHREAIAFNVKTYTRWTDKDPRIEAARLVWWCDELQDWTIEQIAWAFREWNRQNPDKDPTAGHITGIMIRKRSERFAKRYWAQKEAEKEAERVAREKQEAERLALTEDQRAARRAQMAEVLAGFKKMEHGQLKKINSFRGEHGFLSNFFLTDINYCGLTFPSVENAFQASKCADKSEMAAFCEIGPTDAKILGRKVELRADWDAAKIGVMQELIAIKFSDPDLADKLKATSPNLLIEGNTWGDTFWGVCDGEGQNNLGKILMKVRQELLKAGGGENVSDS